MRVVGVWLPVLTFLAMAVGCGQDQRPDLDKYKITLRGASTVVSECFSTDKETLTIGEMELASRLRRAIVSANPVERDRHYTVARHTISLFDDTGELQCRIVVDWHARLFWIGGWPVESQELEAIAMELWERHGPSAVQREGMDLILQDWSERH